MTSVSVCVREHVALRDQLRAQRLEILDDAVVHDGDLAAGQMRMRVDRRRRAVRGPARVRNAGAGGEMRASACAARSATRAVLTSRDSARRPSPFR